jgi:hypothetical protein
MTDPRTRARFYVVLEDAGGPSPDVVRLRRILKSLGRWHGYKCLSAVEAKPPVQAPVPAGGKR